MSTRDTRFERSIGIEVPLVCGPMYPCSNPELVAAVSEAGGIGIVQPLSLVFVHGYNFREGMEFILSQTDRPIGLNVITEKSSKAYQDRMEKYVDISLEMGVRFFITSLGNPKWVVDKAHAKGGIVYHDVTEAKWAKKAVDAGVDGLIAVNKRAGGHAGHLGMEELFKELSVFDKPVLCAGGIADGSGFRRALDIGYAGVQMGTRFIATDECKAHPDYKQAIINSDADDIVHSERITGVPVAVINTPSIQRIGTKASPLARWMLRGHKTKHWMRMAYTVRALWDLKRSLQRPMSSKDFWQAGKSVEAIQKIVPSASVVEECRKQLNNGLSATG